MATIKITHEEAAMMREILQSYLSDLRLEIADTEKKRFRDVLKNQELFVKEFLARLEAA